jgi:predicted XRE-type DNA-binding protein
MIDDPIPALKEQLGRSILAEIGPTSQLAAARMLGLDEARMSNIEHGRCERFSLQKLIRLLARINRRIDLTVVTVGPLPRRGDERLWEARACCQNWQEAQKRRAMAHPNLARPKDPTD